MNPVRLSFAATAEVEEAADVYDVREPGLGDEFRQAVRDAAAAIQAHPEAAARVPRTVYRQYVMPDFPYSLIYAIDPTVFRVVAVAHHKRRSGYWRRRVGP